MEWSRHDKVIITIAAYVIGFTTAFIAFGIGQISNTEQTTHQLSNFNNQSVSDDVSVHAVSVVIENDGLTVSSKLGERLLSARDNASLAANIISSPGLHYAIVDAEISRDDRFVYFCEQLNAEMDTCDPYVYEVNADVLHHVLLDGAAFKPVVENHTSSWSPIGTLTVNYFLSKDTNKPWLLYSQ